MSDTISITPMVHPRIYNEALERAEVEGITVNSENRIEVTDEGHAFNTLVGAVLIADIEKTMVVPTNVSRLRDMCDELRMLPVLNLGGENRAIIEEVIETIEGCCSNLEGDR